MAFNQNSHERDVENDEIAFDEEMGQRRLDRLNADVEVTLNLIVGTVDVRRVPHDETVVAFNFAQFTKRTEDPKLAFLERRLDEMGIAHRRNGSSSHAPILEVDATKLEEAEAMLQEPVEGRNSSLDNIEDDDPMFTPDCSGDGCALCASGIFDEDDEDFEDDSEEDDDSEDDEDEDGRDEDEEDFRGEFNNPFTEPD